jgi:hypothetical protein
MITIQTITKISVSGSFFVVYVDNAVNISDCLTSNGMIFDHGELKIVLKEPIRCI